MNINLIKYTIISLCFLLIQTASAKSFEYNLGKQGSPDEPTSLSCTVLDQNNNIVNDETKVYLTASVLIIRGFSANEDSKEVTTSELNQIYLEAHHNPSLWYFFSDGKLRGDTEVVTYTVQCQEGKGTNRQSLGGDFETQDKIRIEY